jgi:hypothetical protein
MFASPLDSAFGLLGSYSLAASPNQHGNVSMSCLKILGAAKSIVNKIRRESAGSVGFPPSNWKRFHSGQRNIAPFKI